MRFSYKIFRQGDDILLAISDISILGKKIKDKDIEILVSKEFYSENVGDEKRIMEEVKKATIVNAIGNDIVSLLIEKKIVKKDSVLKIGGISHVQIISI